MVFPGKNDLIESPRCVTQVKNASTQDNKVSIRRVDFDTLQSLSREMLTLANSDCFIAEWDGFVNY